MTSINTVIGGEYSGHEIKMSSTSNSAYIAGVDNGAYINKLYVASISDVNHDTTTNLVDAAVGAAIFGSGGAALGINQAQSILEIKWKNGRSSLVKVDADIHEAMIVGMYSDITERQQRTVEAMDSAATTKPKSIVSAMFKELWQNK